MRMFVAAVLFAAAPVFAAPPVLEDVRVLSGPRPAVTIRLSAPAEFRARALQPNGIAPLRLYVDLAGTTLGAGAPRVRDGAGPLLRVRTGQFDPDTTRVVLDLRGEMPFEVSAEGNTVTVTLSPPSLTEKSETEPLAPEPVPKAERKAASPEPPTVAKTQGKPAAKPAAVTPSVPEEKKAGTPDAAPIAKAESKPAAAEPPPPAKTEPRAPQPAPSAAAPKEMVASEAPSLAKGERTPAAQERPSSVEPPAPASETPERNPGPELPSTPQTLVGPPAPAMPPLAAPPRPLTPQDVIVMNAPRSPAPEETVTTTTVPAPSKVEASPRGRAAASGDMGPPAPPPSTLGGKPAPKRPPQIAAAARPTPLVVLDAGHGGRDPGAEGVGGVIEKDVVLEITRVLAKRMTERLHVNVFLTRSDDSYVTIDRRLAVPSDATLFISLHANSCPDPSARGLEIFYGGGAVRPADTAGASPRAALLGRSLGDALSARVGGVRGSARLGSFSILVRNPLPTALIEIGYLTHPEEAALSQDVVYQELMADALVDGLEAFLRAAAPPL
jgi:N-acetylmuramoyl-L-alanine amidase